MKGDYMVKIRLPMRMRTKSHKCSHCQSKKGVDSYTTSKSGNPQWLCSICVGKYNAQFSEEKSVSFVQASKLWRPQDD